MVSKVLKVVDKLGIHVRVACEILQVAKENACDISARKSICGGDIVKIKYPLALVALQARYKESVQFFVSGERKEDENVVLSEIERILHTQSI